MQDPSISTNHTDQELLAAELEIFPPQPLLSMNSLCTRTCSRYIRSLAAVVVASLRRKDL